MMILSIEKSKDFSCVSKRKETQEHAVPLCTVSYEFPYQVPQVSARIPFFIYNLVFTCPSTIESLHS